MTKATPIIQKFYLSKFKISNTGWMHCEGVISLKTFLIGRLSTTCLFGAFGKCHLTKIYMTELRPRITLNELIHRNRNISFRYPPFVNWIFTWIHLSLPMICIVWCGICTAHLRWPFRDLFNFNHTPTFDLFALLRNNARLGQGRLVDATPLTFALVWIASSSLG